MHTYVCVSWGKKCSFFGKFGVLCFLETLVLRFTLLSHYRRSNDYFFRSLGGKLRIGLAEQSVLTSLGHSVVYTPPGQTYPPVILDASESLSTDEFKKELDSSALTIKTAYCELPTYNVIIPKLLESGWKKLPETCHITPGRFTIESNAAKIPIARLTTTH